MYNLRSRDSGNFFLKRVHLKKLGGKGWKYLKTRSGNSDSGDNIRPFTKCCNTFTKSI